MADAASEMLVIRFRSISITTRAALLDHFCYVTWSMLHGPCTFGPISPWPRVANLAQQLSSAQVFQNALSSAQLSSAFSEGHSAQLSSAQLSFFGID